MRTILSYVVSVLVFMLAGFLAYQAAWFQYSLWFGFALSVELQFLLIPIPFGIAFRYLLKSKDDQFLTKRNAFLIFLLVAFFAFVLAFLLYMYELHTL
jgi:hypothetical protein